MSLAAARALRAPTPASKAVPAPVQAPLALPGSPVAALERPVKDLVILDFETYYGADFTLSKMTTEAYIRDPRFEVILVGVKINTRPAAWVTPEAFATWAQEHDWSNTAVLAHHAHFDGLILSHHYGVKPAFWVDTLSMARAIHGTEVGGSLAKLAVHYGAGEKGHEVINAKGKRRIDFTPEEYAAYGDYCRNDVALTHDIFQKMMTRGFPESELWLIDTTVRMFTEPTFKLDEPKLKAYLIEEQTRKADLLERSKSMKADLMSNPKFAALLSELGVDPPMKLSPAALKKGEEKWTHAFSKSDTGMQALLEHDDVRVRTLVEARIGVKSTTNETRTERFLKSGKDGADVPVYLKFYGAHTGRWSGGDSMNFQNLMRGGTLRASLLAPPGKVLVVVDSAQIEPRVTAWLSGHTDLMDTFRRNDATKGDFYSDAGSAYFGKRLSKKETPVERQVAKSMLIGLSYGLGWAKFSQVLLAGALGGDPVQFLKKDADTYNVNVDAFTSNSKFAQRVEEMPSRLSLEDRMVHCAVTRYFVNKYRNTNTPIVELWSLMEKALGAMEEGAQEAFGPGECLRTVRHGIVMPNGLLLRYPGLRRDDSGYTYMGGPRGKMVVKTYGGAMTENIVQALARTVVAEQMLRIRAAGYHIVTMSHDEVVFLADEADAPKALEIALDAMRAVPEWCQGIPLNAEGDFGQSYGDAK